MDKTETVRRLSDALDHAAMEYEREAREAREGYMIHIEPRYSMPYRIVFASKNRGPTPNRGKGKSKRY